MFSPSHIIWWHFSDLHWEVGKFSERSQFFTTLFDDLKARRTKYGNPDFIVLSGDIAHSGEHLQFEDAKKYFLDPLLEICSTKDIPILVVPGNHDISRRRARLINPDIIKSIKSVQSLNEFLDDEDSRQYIITPFEDFRNFYQILNTNTEDESDMLAWSDEFSIRDQKIYIAGINTSWASSYNQDANGKINDERNLLVGQWQFNAMKPRSEDVNLSILIMHHPLNWLLGVVEIQVSNYIQQNFDFVLFGHTHTVHELSQRISPAGQSIYLPSPAIYTPELPDSVEFARGYNIVTYDVLEKKGKAYYYRYSNVAVPQFKSFIDLYPNGQDYYELNLRTASPSPTRFETYHSYTEIMSSSPNLKNIDLALQAQIEKKRYDHNSLEVYDHLALTFIDTTGLVEQNNQEAIWEAFVLCRIFLVFELIELFTDPHRFSLLKVKNSFEAFLRKLTNDKTYTFSVDSSSYLSIASLGLEDVSLTSKYASIPENYMRYYATFWIFNLIAFYFNYPGVTSLVLKGDPRISGIRIDPEDAVNINIITAKYNKISGQVILGLRTRNKEEFLAVTTTQHYISRWIKEVAEYWRHHHRIYPAPVISIEYPLWDKKDISENYLTVEATPIIRLIMGRAFYGGASNIWFRELLQNALDANSTRQGLDASNYTSKIWIYHDEQNTCTIRDNGIGMSYQHIIRYLTTIGRSIWMSDELEAKPQKQKLQTTLGKFGIGFASVFQDAARIFVRTRFFREIDEDGWEVDFTSIDKPFIVERHPFDVGTEVQVILKNPLSSRDFTDLINNFFLYVEDKVEVIPLANIAKCLAEVQLLPQERLSRSQYIDATSEYNIQNNVFNLRTLFCYSYDRENDKDKLPISTVQVSNAGVKVFDQHTLLLTPGKRYMWVTKDDADTESTTYKRENRNEKEVLNHFWILLDFKRGYSPILPSRVEIDIIQEFSNNLLDIIFEQFCNGLEQIIRGIDKTHYVLKSRRKHILNCFMQPIREQKYRGYSEKLREPPSSFCEVRMIQDKVIKLYSIYCPLKVQSLDGSEHFALPVSSHRIDGGIYVLDSIAKTDLFKVYVRALGIQEWIIVESDREFFLFKASRRSDKWQGIYTERDIYKDGHQLFSERIDSPLTHFIRGDYAVVDSDIFGTDAFVVMPPKLPNFWNRGEAALHSRRQVLKTCPARVLLNIRHKLFAVLDKYASNISDTDSEKFLKLLLDNLADGVIEQSRVKYADGRWKAIREEITRLTGESLVDISYRSLRK